ncbi:FadR/GntR family transcriptional regulator [Variovorax sp. J22G21]|uniref:FadR/GntR family transcriptional regulator n=1 Tax=Variovorax fucosicus TaxID=3053517 RepID=UPI002577C0E4|nr:MULTISPECIES: FadR/GntR family transcriptional regulator [unclassified Variovorax]MDM0040532.1 FadR/GntR family transcriptional regulator [Variovorax sp. J22R193]MDM0058650.1 FadR/GntR family transcriptional regulator [Variovorax sp. J22G47]MDM0061905.1 FadR/GntR family transcriptional regulator [Variovorax sp. J22G21]
MASLSTAEPSTPDAGATGPTGYAARPRLRARGLAHSLVDDFGARIRDGALRPGDKLPTESEIMQAFGVSRTVVREALSKLQASGLVETHHGVGTFVLQPRAGGVFRLDPGEIATSVDVLAVLELRISLETESAGLAASRHTEEQLLAMRQALDDFERNVEAAGDTVAPDFRFHLQIAQATGNPYFADIMSHLGTTIIPRTRISAIRNLEGGAYLSRVNREHEEIYAAIARRDPESARAAMRIHLTNSRERLRVAQEAAQRADAAASSAARPAG